MCPAENAGGHTTNDVFGRFDCLHIIGYCLLQGPNFRPVQWQVDIPLILDSRLLTCICPLPRNDFAMLSSQAGTSSTFGADINRMEHAKNIVGDSLTLMDMSFRLHWSGGMRLLHACIPALHSNALNAKFGCTGSSILQPRVPSCSLLLAPTPMRLTCRMVGSRHPKQGDRHC